MKSHHGVREHVQPRVFAIGADAPHLRRKMKNQVWPGVRHELAHRQAVDQIVVVDERYEDLPSPPPLQLFDNETAQETGAAGDHDSSLRKIDWTHLGFLPQKMWLPLDALHFWVLDRKGGR